MPRPRSYDDVQILEAARDVFWENGFERTAISDLERQTGLNRSSLYHAFGGKRTLFKLALENYVETFIDPLLAAMEQDPATPQGIRTFFLASAAHFSSGRVARRGCLIINAIGQGPRGDDEAARIIRSYPARLMSAFTQCLRSPSAAMTRTQVDRRAAMLASAALGVWLSARVDPQMAARRCRNVAREVASWRSA